ncbi:MAG: glycosyltransferase family 2 protein [Melioribacteraceae bacterium]
MKDLVSIVIPVYNRVTLISQTIECAINQTYDQIEIVIIDNCSEDGTWEILTQYTLLDNRISLFRNEQNIGPVRNWIRCVTKTRGKYVKILFSDDVMLPTFVEETISVFDSDVAFVLGRIEIFNNHGTLRHDNFNDLKSLSTEDYIQDIILLNRLGLPVSPSAALFRREDMINALVIEIPNPEGLVNERYGAGNDLFIYLLIAKNYNRVVFTNSYLIKFRDHEASFTSSNDLEIYYLYSKLHFLKNYHTVLLNKFCTLLFLKQIFNLKYSKIYEYSPQILSYKYMMILIAVKIKNKLMKLFIHKSLMNKSKKDG